MLNEVRAQYESSIPIAEVITDHGTEFVNPQEDDRPCLDQTVERYLQDAGITHTLCVVGHPQSNGKIERFYKTYEKQRWRFDTLNESGYFYNDIRPHMSLLWDEVETPSEAFDKLLPQPEVDDEVALLIGGDRR